MTGKKTRVAFHLSAAAAYGSFGCGRGLAGALGTTLISRNSVKEETTSTMSTTMTTTTTTQPPRPRRSTSWRFCREFCRVWRTLSPIRIFFHDELAIEAPRANSR